MSITFILWLPKGVRHHGNRMNEVIAKAEFGFASRPEMSRYSFGRGNLVTSTI